MQHASRRASGVLGAALTAWMLASVAHADEPILPSPTSPLRPAQEVVPEDPTPPPPPAYRGPFELSAAAGLSLGIGQRELLALAMLREQFVWHTDPVSGAGFVFGASATQRLGTVLMLDGQAVLGYESVILRTRDLAVTGDVRLGVGVLGTPTNGAVYFAFSAAAGGRLFLGDAFFFQLLIGFTGTTPGGAAFLDFAGGLGVML